MITGSAGGRRLKEPAGRDTRPTADRVKEGVFSALQFEIAGRRVLDLFAGTGQLGIECLSRGAAYAVFVEQDPQALEIVRENLRRTGFTDRAQAVAGEALAYLARTRERFDLVFLDPPYESGLLEAALKQLGAFDILNPHGIIAAEHPAGRTLSGAGFAIRRTYRYGKAAVTLLCPGGGEKDETGNGDENP